MPNNDSPPKDNLSNLGDNLTAEQIFGSKPRVSRSPIKHIPLYDEKGDKISVDITSDIERLSFEDDKLKVATDETGQANEIRINPQIQTGQSLPTPHKTGNITLRKPRLVVPSSISTDKPVTLKGTTNQGTKEPAIDSALENVDPQKEVEQASGEQHILHKTQFKIGYEILDNDAVIREKTLTLPLPDVGTDLQLVLEAAFRDFASEPRHRQGPVFEDRSEDWTISDMAEMTIKEVTDLIPHYAGEENKLNGFIKNIDRLWTHIHDYSEADKSRFLLVLQLRLTEKATEATKNANFQSWDDVKAALKRNINPQNNIEKAELKLVSVKQTSQEDVEAYGRRVEGLLDDLNKSFDIEDGNEVIAKENDRKARKAFENGLHNNDLRSRTIARGNKTFQEAVDYAVEQELRQYELRPKNTPEKYCTRCRTRTHNTEDCRARSTPNPQRRTPPNNLPDVVCYRCNQRGHYANNCPAQLNPSNRNQQNNQNSPRDQNRQPNSPGNLNPNERFRSPRDNPRNVRFFDSEMPLEEAISIAENEDRELKN